MTETGELTYRRVHRASPELLFDCMTTPEHLTHFWGPAGTTTPVDNITVDLRPGGVFETTMVNDADGSTYTMRAVYVEVRRPDRLVWIEADVEGGMRTTITFVDLQRRAHRGGHPPDQRAGRVPQRRGAGRVRHQPRPLRRLRGRSARTSRTREHDMPTVTSADGTTIAYERTGSGPAARPRRRRHVLPRARDRCGRSPRCCRTRFTVYTYDRRGRGESSDTAAVRGRPRGRGPAGPHRAGRRRGVRLRHLLRRGARPGDRGGRRRDHQAGALRAAVHGRGRGRHPGQGVHRTAPRAARRRATGATPWRCS